MASLNVAFWNVQNLFEPGVVSRGPQTPAELDEKLAVLGDVINAFFGGDGPDVLGLAEVNTKRIFLELVRRLNHRYPARLGRRRNQQPDGLGVDCPREPFRPPPSHLDGQSWLNDFPWQRMNYPLLFDRQRQPKPAFEAVIKALETAQRD